MRIQRCDPQKPGGEPLLFCLFPSTLLLVENEPPLSLTESDKKSKLSPSPSYSGEIWDPSRENIVGMKHQRTVSQRCWPRASAVGLSRAYVVPSLLEARLFISSFNLWITHMLQLNQLFIYLYAPTALCMNAFHQRKLTDIAYKMKLINIDLILPHIKNVLPNFHTTFIKLNHR